MSLCWSSFKNSKWLPCRYLVVDLFVFVPRISLVNFLSHDSLLLFQNTFLSWRSAFARNVDILWDQLRQLSTFILINPLLAESDCLYFNILRPNRDQWQKVQRFGLHLGEEPATLQNLSWPSSRQRLSTPSRRPESCLFHHWSRLGLKIYNSGSRKFLSTNVNSCHFTPANF